MFLLKKTIKTLIIVIIITIIIIIIIIIIKTSMTNLSFSFNNSAYIWQIERIVKNSE